MNNEICPCSAQICVNIFFIVIGCWYDSCRLNIEQRTFPSAWLFAPIHVLSSYCTNEIGKHYLKHMCNIKRIYWLAVTPGEPEKIDLYWYEIGRHDLKYQLKNQLSLQFQGATNIERGLFGGIPSAFDQNTWPLLIAVFFVTSFFFWLVCRISPYEHLDSHQVLNLAFYIWDKILFNGLHCVHDKMVFWYVYDFTFKLEHVTSTNSSRNFWEKNTIRKHI